MTTPRLGAPELVVDQATPETTVNEQIRYLESGAGHFIFKDRDLAPPPGSPADGDCYLVAGSPTGAWTGHAGDIAFRVNTAWAFIEVIEGFTAWVNDENVFIGYDGAAWNTLASPSGVYQPLDTDLTVIAGLVDPNADRILFWDDSAGAYAYLTAGSGLSIAGTTITATGSGGDVVGPASSTAGHVAVFDGATGKLLKDAGVVAFANGATIVPTATPSTTEVGYLGCPQNIQNGTYTTVMGDAGKHIYHTSGSAHTWTIDSNANVAYPIGTILTFLNESGGGIVTLAITSDTLRWGSSTGSRSLAANGTATAIKVTSTVWRLTGDGIT